MQPYSNQWLVQEDISEAESHSDATVRKRTFPSDENSSNEQYSAILPQLETAAQKVDEGDLATNDQLQGQSVEHALRRSKVRHKKQKFGNDGDVKTPLFTSQAVLGYQINAHYRISKHNQHELVSKILSSLNLVSFFFR